MPPQAHWNELILVVIALLLVIVAGVIVLTILRRRAQNNQQLMSGEPFTLEQLRQLYNQRQLTESEFQRAKAILIERIRGSAEAAPPAENGGTMDGGSQGTSSS